MGWTRKQRDGLRESVMNCESHPASSKRPGVILQSFEGLYTLSPSLSRVAAAVPEHGFFDLAAVPEHHRAAASQVLLFSLAQV